MARHIMFCEKSQRYTLEVELDGEKTVLKKPPKYSPEDKYGDYRRQVKRPNLEEKGLI